MVLPPTGHWLRRKFRVVSSVLFTLRIKSATEVSGIALVEGKWPCVWLDGTVEVGQGFVVSGRTVRTELGAQSHARLHIGERVYINQGCSIVATANITIGDDCLIGDFTSIMDSTFHSLSSEEPVKVEPVTIGNNVWIGRSCLVFPGVSIGDNAVIGSGSVVTKSVAPNTLVAGNPAIVIRTLEIKDGWTRH